MTQIKRNVRDVFSFRQNFPYWNESRVEDAGRQVLLAARCNLREYKEMNLTMSFRDTLASAEAVPCGVLLGFVSSVSNIKMQKLLGSDVPGYCSLLSCCSQQVW